MGQINVIKIKDHESKKDHLMIFSTDYPALGHKLKSQHVSVWVVNQYFFVFLLNSILVCT